MQIAGHFLQKGWIEERRAVDGEVGNDLVFYMMISYRSCLLQKAAVGGKSVSSKAV